ncbi:MAG: 30S ribosomal protein S17 [Phycisphaerae bacterium]
MSTSETKNQTPRKSRATRIGVVSSAGRDKTVAVTVSYRVLHPKYGKIMERNSKLHAHDEENACSKGDRVEIVETRPMSKTKSWRVVRILEKAPEQPGVSR